MAALMGVLSAAVLSNLLLFHSVLGSDIPVLIWGKGGDSSNFPAVSALSVISQDTFSKNFLPKLVNQKNPLIVVFFQDELSRETFSVFGREEAEDNKSTVFSNLDAALKTRPFLCLNVKNPADAIQTWARQYETKVVRPDDGLEAVAGAARQSNVLLYGLPDTATAADKKEALRNNDAIMGAVEKTIEGERSDVMFMFTGQRPAWESAEPRLLSRRLLASVDSDNCTLLNISDGRILLCIDNVTFTYVDVETKEFNTTTWHPVEVTYGTSSAGNMSSTIVLDFPKSDWVSSLRLSMDFNQSAGSWSMVSATASFDMKPDTRVLKGDANMSLSDVGAAQGFSYSCGKTTLSGKFDNDTVAVTFDFFQVQPFDVVNDRFSDSFDCSTFFTIPIWMGLFVVILFTAILAVGIYLLFEVHTMDRFDDPKGKPLVFTTSD